MLKTLVLSKDQKIAFIFENDKLITDLIIEQGPYQIGDIYIGLVNAVLPSINAAFILLDSSQVNGFIHISNLGHLKRNNRTVNIVNHLFCNSFVMVQILKAPSGTKAPTLTGKINLKGRSLTLLPFSERVFFSKNFSHAEEKLYLKALFCLLKPDFTGIIIHSMVIHSNVKNIIQDFYFLLYKWDTICNKAFACFAPTLISNDDNFVLRVMQKIDMDKITTVVIDSLKEGKKIASIISRWKDKQNLMLSIKYFQRYDFFIRNYNLDLLVYDLLQSRINLYGGAYIIIEKTEALTTIDVNSGSFNYFNNPRETILLVNKRAAKQIARHINLRNISGVIIVDFIDMNYQQDQLDLLIYFDFLLKQDKSKPNIVQFSELGLVELTRKRQSKTLSENFFINSDSAFGLDYGNYINSKLSKLSLGHTLFLESYNIYSY